jgi:hypothetical protein
MPQRLLPHQAPAEPSPSPGLLNNNDQTVARSYPTAGSITCRRKINEPREREKPEESRSKTGRKNRNFDCVFSSFAGDGGCHYRQGKEEEKWLSQIPLFPVSSSRQRVNPGAASGGGAWRRRDTIILQLQKSA